LLREAVLVSKSQPGIINRGSFKVDEVKSGKQARHGKQTVLE
jgi:hypothetical protein